MYKTVCVDVDVDMKEFTDDELIRELESRKYSVAKGEPEPGDPWVRLAEAYHFNQDPERVLRDLVYQQTGRVL